MNTDAISYQSKTPKKRLETAKRKKKRKYLNNSFNNRKHYTSFVASVNGLLGAGAEATLKRIAINLAHKCQEPYSCCMGHPPLHLGGQGSVVLNQREPSSVGIKQGPPPLIVRRVAHPKLINLPPPLSSPPHERAHQRSRRREP